MEDQSVEPAEVELSSQALSPMTGVPAPSGMLPPSRVGLLVPLSPPLPSTYSCHAPLYLDFHQDESQGAAASQCPIGMALPLSD
jgi:hypothetical protein